MNPYRFSGKRIHGGTGTYDIGFRDYDPGINRFLTRDFYQGALNDLALGMDPWNTNRYAYAGGNPIGGVDLDGHAALAPNGDGSDSSSSWWDGVVDMLSGQGDAPQVWTSDGLRAPAPATTPNPSVTVSTGDGDDASGGAVNAATETLEHANPALWAFSSLTGINPWEDASESFNDKHGVDTTTNAYAAGGLAFDVVTALTGGVAGKAISKVAGGAAKYGDDAVETLGKTCNSFTGQTLVLMADGTRKPIKDVKLGDWVMAKNPVTGLAAPRQVIDLIRHSGPHTMVKIRLADGTIIDATDHHPFWVKTHGVNGRWTDAIDLAAGDVLLTSAGATETVAGVSINEQDLTAYNLTVDELHTYYVSGDDVLVHNATCPFGAVAGPNGEMLPLPKGATGTRSATGKGWTYDIPKGTEGLDPRVTQVRLMDPVLKGIHQYPNGYVVYMNKADQSVNPLTGQTLSKADPYNHLPLPPP